jgi:hypothetical protein
MKRILVIAVLALIAIALLAVIRPPQRDAENQGVPGAVALPDLGVSVVLPTGLEGLAVATTTVQRLGTVLHVAVPPAPGSGGTACELGVFYNVRKADLAAPGTRWNEETLRAAAAGSEGIPPQAKEFPEFYFVFEPSQAACSTDEAQMQIEIALRQALWLSVSSAMLLPEGPAPMSVEDYVRSRISELSPIKEQVGGTFYVTAIEAVDGSGVVSYEDGHNAYTADFTYAIDAAGRPAVTGFVIR